MAVQIRKQDKTVEAALRRIAGVLIGEAIAAIDAVDMPFDRRVHEVRQATKKLRALIRLVRPAFDRFALVNASLRDLARSLSGARDAQVMIDTVDDLFEDHPDELAGIDLEAIRSALAPQPAVADDQIALADARTQLVTLRAEARRWSLGQEGWAAVEGGLRATYRKARRLMRKLERHGDAGTSHDWRKHVKYHGQHIRLIEAMAPDALHDRAHRLHKLGDLLGRRHDLDVLVLAMAAHPETFGGIAAARRIDALVRHRIRRLDKRARKLGEPLFERTPGRMMRHWAAEWRDWREDEARVAELAS